MEFIPDYLGGWLQTRVFKFDEGAEEEGECIASGTRPSAGALLEEGAVSRGVRAACVHGKGPVNGLPRESTAGNHRAWDSSPTEREAHAFVLFYASKSVLICYSSNRKLTQGTFFFPSLFSLCSLRPHTRA